MKRFNIFLVTPKNDPGTGFHFTLAHSGETLEAALSRLEELHRMNPDNEFFLVDVIAERGTA